MAVTFSRIRSKSASVCNRPGWTNALPGEERGLPDELLLDEPVVDEPAFVEELPGDPAEDELLLLEELVPEPAIREPDEDELELEPTPADPDPEL